MSNCGLSSAGRVSAAVVLLLASGLVGCGSADVASSNLLVVTIDTLRADRLGAWGYGAAETPAIDRLAAEGVRFARALAPAPTTLPSHATIFTGTTPPVHGARDNITGPLRQSAVTLAERFRDAGFATGAFVGAVVLDRGLGLSQGFDHYSDPRASTGVGPTGMTGAELRGDQVIGRALPWIEEQAGGPWFAWIHVYDPHAPYTAPEPYGSRHAADPYDGEVAWVDALVGHLRAALEEMGEWDETTVVLTSDHGEALGEHGEETHGLFLYEEVLHVPLVIRPAAAAAGALVTAATVETPVGLVDLFPTVTELWGLEPGEQVEGRSLAPALAGRPLEVVPLLAETLLPRLYFGWSELRAVTDDRFKLIQAPRPELYDLQEDPDESDNLHAARIDDVAGLETTLDEWSERSPVTGGGAGDRAALARLRSLGYLALGSGAAGEELADPKDRVETYRNLNGALVAWRQGRVDEALEMIGAELETDPEFAGAWYYRGLILAGAARPAEAVEAFRTAYEIDPEHTVAARELARAHRQLDQLAQATAILEEVVAVEPLDVGLRAELGSVYLQRQLPGEAARVLREGLEAAPDAAPLVFGLGLVALQQGNPGRALEELERAAELAPELANLHYQRARILQGLGRVDEALAAYGAEISHQPTHHAARFNRALLLAQAGRTEEAIEDLRVAVRARPGAAEARLFLAQALLDTGEDDRIEEARQLAEGAIGEVSAPRLRAMGHLTLAQIYAAQGREDDAEAQRQAAARLGGGR